MAIINPNSISLGEANKYWVIKCTLTEDLIIATLAPWDGKYIIGNSSTYKRVQIPSGTMCSVVFDNIFTKIASMGDIPNISKIEDIGKFKIKVVDIDAHDSLVPVKVVAVYDSGITEVRNGQIVPVMGYYQINDLFAVANVDPELAQAYIDIMAAIAGAV